MTINLLIKYKMMKIYSLICMILLIKIFINKLNCKIYVKISKFSIIKFFTVKKIN